MDFNIIFVTDFIIFQPLEKLLLADNKLRLGASALFDCLGTNESIKTIDIRFIFKFQFFSKIFLGLFYL